MLDSLLGFLLLSRLDTYYRGRGRPGSGRAWETAFIMSPRQHCVHTSFLLSKDGCDQEQKESPRLFEAPPSRACLAKSQTHPPSSPNSCSARNTVTFPYPPPKQWGSEKRVPPPLSRSWHMPRAPRTPPWDPSRGPGPGPEAPSFSGVCLVISATRNIQNSPHSGCTPTRDPSSHCKPGLPSDAPSVPEVLGSACTLGSRWCVQGRPQPASQLSWAHPPTRPCVIRGRSACF